MEKVYKSKVDRWLIWFFVAMVLAFAASIWLCLDSTPVLIIDIVMMGICLAMLCDMLLHTDYTIAGDKLRIRCGILYRQTIPISKITEITHKSTILSSPALSTNRICLHYGKTQSVYVSPKDQPSFIASLQSLNPSIQIT